MDKHTEQHLDKLAEKIIKQSNLESPSLDFTASIMEQIQTIPAGKSITYKPLISKYGWLTIIAVLISISVYLILNSTGNSNWANAIDFSVISNNKLTETLSGLTISKTSIYAVCLFGLMLYIQIPILKQYHNKQFEV